MFVLQVIDFGSSCYENQRVYTYIQSRFYRAPEVILGAKYSMPIDMWSLGCILVELVTGFPLLPGEDEADQLACIIELLGMPPQRLLDNAKRTRQFISSKGYPRYCAASTMSDGTVILGSGLSRRGKLRGPPGSKQLRRVLLGCDDPLFLDFIKKCLEWDPELRMTPSKALKHAWLRRRLPKPPVGEKSDGSLPSVPASVSSLGSTGLRTTPASSSRSSSKTNIIGSASLYSKVRQLSDQLGNQHWSSTMPSRHSQPPAQSGHNSSTSQSTASQSNHQINSSSSGTQHDRRSPHASSRGSSR